MFIFLVPITITSKPNDNIQIEYGQTIILKVTGTTDPSKILKYKWYYNGGTLDVRPPYLVLNRTINELTLDTSVLTREEVEKLMGVYVCDVSHDLQTLRVKVNLSLMNTTDPVYPTEGIAYSIIIYE